MVTKKKLKIEKLALEEKNKQTNTIQEESKGDSSIVKVSNEKIEEEIIEENTNTGTFTQINTIITESIQIQDQNQNKAESNNLQSAMQEELP